MADTAQDQPKTIAKAGIPSAAKLDFGQTQLGAAATGVGAPDNNDNGQQSQPNQPVNTNTNQNSDTNNNAGAANTDAGKKTDPVTTEINEDQVRAYFEKQGIPFENMDSLKSKLTAPAPAAELTQEQKDQLAKDKENRVLSEYLKEKDASIEKFAAYKQVLAADKKILGLETERQNLLDAGYTKEAAEATLKEKYSQFTDDEINNIEDEEEKKQAIKDRAYGNSKLERKGANLQKNTKDYLDRFSQIVDDKDADAKLMEQHSSKVEDAVKKIQRGMKLNLGQINEQDVAPIDFEVSDAAINSVKGMIGNRDEFEKQLLTKDGHYNLDYILPHLVRSFSMDEAIKASYLEATDRATKFIKSKFGTDLPVFGGQQQVNGKKESGKIARAGQPKVASPFANNSQ